MLLSAERLRYHVAEIDGVVTGVVGVRDGTHLLHLFVAERSQGRGVARQLWDAARGAAVEPSRSGRFTVNASRNAVAVYERFGFEATGPVVRKDGLAFVPMVLAR